MLEDLEKSGGLAGDLASQERELHMRALGKAAGGHMVKALNIS